MTSPETGQQIDPAEQIRRLAYGAVSAANAEISDRPAVAKEVAEAFTPVIAAAYEDGKGDGRAEGRRQATEGWEREWGVEPGPGADARYDEGTEADARRFAALQPDRRVVSRLVGPWEPAEQADPLADDPVARRLGLVDAEGRTLCRCLAGSPDCTHRPAEQTQDRAQ